MGRTCSTHRAIRNAYRILVGKAEGMRPRGRWEDNIKMDLKEMGCDAGDWTDLAHDSELVIICILH